MHHDRSGSAPASGEASTHNVFFGLFPDAQTRVRMAAAVESLQVATGVQGRWLKPERYHLTLHFLGTFSGLPQPLMDAAQKAAAMIRVPSFAVEIDRAGHFPGGIGWLGCDATDAGLRSLHDALHAALAQAGVATQGHARFTPHVTVLRAAHRPLPARPVPSIAWRVREFLLIDSRLGAGSDYRTLGRWPLMPE